MIVCRGGRHFKGRRLKESQEGKGLGLHVFRRDLCRGAERAWARAHILQKPLQGS